MHFERGQRCRVHRVLVLFIVLWAALAIMGGALNKADVEPGSGPGSDGSAIELALKLCAAIFTAVATAASGVLHKRWRLIPAYCAGISRCSPTRFKRRYRPPPHGFALLRQLQIIVV